MPRGQRSSRPKQPDAYRHDEAYRLNNPEAGLALYEASEAPQVHFEHRVTTDQPWDPRIRVSIHGSGAAEAGWPVRHAVT